VGAEAGQELVKAKINGLALDVTSNSPVVVLKDGKLAFVFGTPGGETIGQTEFQMLVNLIDFQLPVQQAIEAPRFCSMPSRIYKPIGDLCRSRIGCRLLHQALKAMGHTLRISAGWAASYMQTINRSHDKAITAGRSAVLATRWAASTTMADFGYFATTNFCALNPACTVAPVVGCFTSSPAASATKIFPDGSTERLCGRPSWPGPTPEPPNSLTISRSLLRNTVMKCEPPSAL
jgi:hypothetical protein